MPTPKVAGSGALAKSLDHTFSYICAKFGAFRLISARILSYLPTSPDHLSCHGADALPLDELDAWEILSNGTHPRPAQQIASPSILLEGKKFRPWLLGVIWAGVERHAHKNRLTSFKPIP